MRNRELADHDLESLRRSLAMLQTNQLALTRDQGIDLVTQLLGAREHIRQLDAERVSGSVDPTHPDRSAGA